MDSLERCNDKDISEVDIKRLADHAGQIIGVIWQSVTSEKGVNAKQALFIASAAAGYACHNAVKSIDPALFAVVNMKDGKNFYFGDAVNKFFAENKSSVLSFCVGAYEGLNKGARIPDVVGIIKSVAQNVGNPSYRIWGEVDLATAYKTGKSWFNSIYEHVMKEHCRDVREQQIILAIVLQNIMLKVMTVGPHSEVFYKAVECVCFVSKMDDDSI